MAKVSDMLRGIDDPMGTIGYIEDQAKAADLAETMRRLLRSDMEEWELAIKIHEENKFLNEDQDLFIAAWRYLNAGERRAWKLFVEAGRVGN
jgi:hypothetical protein